MEEDLLIEIANNSRIRANRRNGVAPLGRNVTTDTFLGAAH